MQHHFDIDLAKKYGILEAVLLDNFCFWTVKNAANEVHIHDGRVWTYNSVKAFCEMMPYASSKQIRRALSHLEADGLIVTGNFNNSPYDRTKWYALTDKAFFECHLGNFDLPKRANGEAEKGKPIPYTIVPPDIIESGSSSLILNKYNITTPPTPPEDADAGWLRVINAYEANIGLLPTGKAFENLLSYYGDLGADVMVYAIELTNMAQPDRPKPYLAKLLASWAERGIDTLQKAKADTAEHKRKTQPRQQREDDRPEIRPEQWLG